MRPFSLLTRLAGGLRSTSSASSPAEHLERARWAYRTILLREPDSEEALARFAAAHPTPQALRDALLRSAEARAQPGFPVLHTMTSDEPPQVVQVAVAPAERAELFRRVQAVWRALGETRPHWSVITHDEYGPENIARTEEAFYASGEHNVATLLRTLARNGIDPARLRTVMDFGCGVGRLSVALARRFERVLSVDVSASHLTVAREALARRGITNATTHQLETIEGLAGLPRCDLVYSLMVLQHNPPPVIHALLAGLLERLAPGGLAVIQLPTRLPDSYRFEVGAYLAGGGAGMEMHPLPQPEVFALARAAGVVVLEVLEDGWTGFGFGARSNTFVLQRDAR
ncbi:MAG TPA: class I SAM-dependent methyltransferase [Planctomycetota bacterium]